ncbi:MAG: hypothetical protein ACI8XM_000879 [Haloarculaceae archaeon]|jgi:hypothetical protein
MAGQSDQRTGGQGNQQGQSVQGGQQSQPPRQQSPQGGQRASDLDVLFSGEEVLIDARPAWTAWTAHLVFAGLIVLVGLFSRDQAALGITIIIALATVGYVWYQRRKVRYVVTDQRVMVITGITAKKTNEAWMEDVKGMQTGASFLERLLGHGHITLSRQILPRGSLLPTSLLPGVAPGMTLGGISNYEDIAATIRERQAEQKSNL